MNIKFLLLGTSLSLIPTLTNAQCVATTDCATLGYTEKSCPDGKGIRCPFGTTYACCSDNCVKNGFIYECKENIYIGGNGHPCNNKYASCACTEGYEWKDGKCEATLGSCSGKAQNCKIGDILNSDGTCSDDKVSGKTPIGVVIYINNDSDKCGYAMTANPIATNIKWSSGNIEVSIETVTSWQTVIKNYNACANTQKIIKADDNSKYPAAWAAYNYTPSAAPETKGKWCLPAPGMLNSLYNNLNTINNTLSKLGGTKLTGDNEHIWSSLKYDSNRAWYFCTNAGAKQDGLAYTDWASGTSAINVVRPVLPF